ncbi:MAG: hypothetical protein Q9220_007217 [cf. Caloplaca sp. 1 TL-2023]
MSSNSSTKPQQPQDDTDTPTESGSQSLTMSPLMARDMAKQHGIHRDHANWRLYPDFQKEVQRPYDEARNYTVRPESEQLFDTFNEYYGNGDEESFKNKFLSLIVKDEFDMKITPAAADSNHNHMDLEEKPGPFHSGASQADGSRSDSDNSFRRCTPILEGVAAQYNAHLRQDYLPHNLTGPGYREASDESIQRYLQSLGMTTPDPDAIWGFVPSKMPQGIFTKEIFEMMTLCPNMHFPSFTCHCALDSSNYDECLNQSSRTGAAINNATLQVLRRAGYDVDKPGPTLNVYTYALTFDKHIAHFWVHWTEIDSAGDRLFHMNAIAPKITLEGPGVLAYLRNKAQAVIEWALKTRMPIVKAYYHGLMTVDQKAQREAMMIK